MRIEQPRGKRGSLKWIQKLVQYHPSLLDARLQDVGALEVGGSLTWVSPLDSDQFAEYRDEDFLDRLGLGRHAKELRAFWPNRGPQWDGLATNGNGKVFLFEAKAHAAEMASTCQAGSASRQRILAA